MNLQILPLAITMMIGPAIMASIVFVTHEQAVPVSVAYLLGVTIGTVVGVAIAMGLARVLGDNVSLGDSSERGSAGTIIQIALVLLAALASLAFLLFRRRATVVMPTVRDWMNFTWVLTYLGARSVRV